MNDRDDPILDVCLDEVLGGQHPPDLSAPIMRAWQERQSAGERQSPQESVGRIPYVSAALQLSEPVPPPVQAMPPTVIQVSDRAPFAQRTPHRAAWATSPAGWAVAAGLAMLLLGGAWASWRFTHQGSIDQGIVRQPPVEPGDHSQENKNSTAVVSDRSSEKSQTPERRAKVDASPSASPTQLTDSPPGSPAFAVEPSFDVRTPKARSVTAPPHYSASPDGEVVAFINHELQATWTASQIAPAEVATDSEWCRRAYLRLLGRIPTVEELDRFAGAAKTSKGGNAGRPASFERRNLLIDELLEGEDYREEFARHWSNVLANVLVGRSGGTTSGGPASREGLLQYLRQALAHDKPYDRLAYELISATGSNQPGAEDYNGAVNYLLSNMSDKGTLATTRTSQVFLGVHLQCAQCHQHPSNTLAQDQYWQLNAFFRQMAAERVGQSGVTRLVNRDFRGERGDPGEAEVYFENAQGELRVAYPVFFVDGSDLPHSGIVEEVDRRTELAEMVVRTDNLARAAVNRLWAHFCGFGFTRPVDDIGPHNPPSHPELLDRLAHEFAGHGYDLKRVMRWIALSDAFNRSSRIATGNVADAPDRGTVPLFSRYYTRQMQAEELYQSLQMLANVRRKGSVGEQEQAKLAWLGQFTRNMGTDEGMEEHLFNGSIPQSLSLMNGDLTRTALSTEQGSFLARVAQSKLKPEQKIEHLFESGLSRKPSKRELTVARELIAARGDELSALQDLWWALLNSSEFILDH